MSSWATPPVTANDACSGKCRRGACGVAPRVWVVAACEGMVSLFEKDMWGAPSLLSQQDGAVFTSLEKFQKSIGEADYARAFDQLVIVGSSTDIAWIHASLPPSSTHHIAAEIEYPLIPGWFTETGFPHLSNALENVFSG